MLRKSVETRDWVHSLEPWTVRAVMKRVLEEIALVETQVSFYLKKNEMKTTSLLIVQSLALPRIIV